jgi:hypothetical protein
LRHIAVTRLIDGQIQVGRRHGGQDGPDEWVVHGLQREPEIAQDAAAPKGSPVALLVAVAQNAVLWAIVSISNERVSKSP